MRYRRGVEACKKTGVKICYGGNIFTNNAARRVESASMNTRQTRKRNDRAKTNVVEGMTRI